MNCIVVEDEPAARSVMENYINRFPGLKCLGVFTNAFDAQEFLINGQADLMFLDINLPEMSGISFLKHTKQYFLTDLHKME